ncbi:hypothetical protein L0Z72_15870 [candidate division KSB1 bacterium]|nr:hypothetical protein [candidate division KSB1 bacterium]
MSQKGKFVELPEEIKLKVEAIKSEWVTSLNDRTLAWGKKIQQIRRAEQPGLEWGEPITQVNFPWWDVLVAGPFQFPNAVLGPYKPSKIIADGELAVMIVALWRNPAAGTVGVPPATLMGGRPYTLNFELMNITTVSNVIFPQVTGVFTSFPSSFIDIHVVAFMPTSPSGEGHPDIYEMNVTCDLTGPGNLPMAAFASWVYDPDTEPAFLFLPTMPAGMRHERPIRFMVYTR